MKLLSTACKMAAILILVSGILGIHAQAQEMQIDVHAGSFDRHQSVTSFYFPGPVDEGSYTIRSEAGHETVLQVDANNRGWLRIETLPAGETISYLFDGSSAGNPSGVTYREDENTLLIQSGDYDILSYFHGENQPQDGLDERYRRGGYIHPVYSPNGVVLTNHLNVEEHPHHSGIWAAWTNTEFEGRTPDFWNIHGNTGRVDVEPGTFTAWDGPVYAGFTSKHQYWDLSAPEGPEIAVNEKWDVRVFKSEGNYHLFDLKVTHTVNTGKPLLLPEYRYGGVGFRGHVEWDDPENCTFLTSDGLGRDGHGTRTRWTHIGGTVDGELAGIAIMSHPSNFRHPQTVRIHPTEPFFNYAPQQLGDMSIEPGSPYIVTYRYITYDGEPDPEKLDRLWHDFAYPPGVTVLINNH